MAHFAEIDENNKVLRVLVISNEFEKEGEKYLSKTLKLGGRWIQTSYNNNLRGKFAGAGDIYLEEFDRFIPPSPYPSWTLDADFAWQPPKKYPEDGKMYKWDEANLEWILNETLAE